MLLDISDGVFRSKWMLPVAAAIGRLSDDFDTDQLKAALEGAGVEATAPSRLLTQLVEVGLLERRGRKGSGLYRRLYPSLFRACEQLRGEIEARKPRKLRAGQER